MHRSRHEKWVDLTGFQPRPDQVHSIRSTEWEDLTEKLRYWALVLVFACLWVVAFFMANQYFSTGSDEVTHPPTLTGAVGFSSSEKTGVYIARQSDLRGSRNNENKNQLGGIMPVVKYFGLDSEMDQVYNGRRWWFFKHQWMPEVGGICRIVILGHVWEIYRRQPWQELAKKSSLVPSNGSER